MVTDEDVDYPLDNCDGCVFDSANSDKYQEACKLCADMQFDEQTDITLRLATPVEINKIKRDDHD